jgi:hypothetical protein
LQKNNEEIGVSIFPLATVNTFLPQVSPGVRPISQRQKKTLCLYFSNCSHHLPIPCNVAAGEGGRIAKEARARHATRRGCCHCRLPGVVFGVLADMGSTIKRAKSSQSRARGDTRQKKRRGNRGWGGGDRRRNRATRQCPSTGAGATLPTLLTGAEPSIFLNRPRCHPLTAFRTIGLPKQNEFNEHPMRYRFA